MADVETDLMRAMRQGDREGFRRLYERYQAPIFTYFLRLCRNRSTAEDLTQETFLRVWRGAASWKPTAKVSTWLFTIAHNLWINASVKSSRAPLAPSMNEESPALERNELRAAILEAIARLPAPEKEAYVMSEFGGMKYVEIADVLGVPVGTVKSRIFTACGRLREALRPFLDR